MINIFTILLIIGFIIFIRNKNKEQFITVSPNDANKLMPTTTVQMIPKGTPIEKQFLQEQEYGANVNILYPNTWVDCIDSKGSGLPQWNSREKITGNVNKIILPRAINSYNFNKEKIVNMDKPVGIDNNSVDRNNVNTGKKIKDIYDNSFVNFKNLIPNKTIISDTFGAIPSKVDASDRTPDIQLMNGASNLQFLTPDTWIYENEKGENGGVMYANKTTTVFASDPSTEGIVATF